MGWRYVTGGHFDGYDDIHRPHYRDCFDLSLFDGPQRARVVYRIGIETISAGESSGIEWGDWISTTSAPFDWADAASASTYLNWEDEEVTDKVIVTLETSNQGSVWRVVLKKNYNNSSGPDPDPEYIERIYKPGDGETMELSAPDVDVAASIYHMGYLPAD
jgi:hypothetical protein